MFSLVTAPINRDYYTTHVKTIRHIVIFNNSLKKISETDRNVDFKYS